MVVTLNMNTSELSPVLLNPPDTMITSLCETAHAAVTAMGMLGPWLQRSFVGSYTSIVEVLLASASPVLPPIMYIFPNKEVPAALCLAIIMSAPEAHVLFLSMW